MVPKIDTGTLWQLGAVGGVPWRIWIRLAYIWDTAKLKNGGKRLYATRPEVLRGPEGVIIDQHGRPVVERNGKPVKSWGHPSAVRTGQHERNPQSDIIPVLGTKELALLGFDDGEVSSQATRERARRTRVMLGYMEDIGLITLEWDRSAVRILQPWTPHASEGG